jgi:hypothetical protein
MGVSKSVLVVALVCLSSFAAAQQSDQAVAERVLGPQWRQLSRRAGMIFTGTVRTVSPLDAATQSGTTQNLATQNLTIQSVATAHAATGRVVPGTTPAVELSFRVDHAIAGVERGQVLTIREWAGAWTMQRPMSSGQHILIFLYPPSYLGFTSPVGGALGQVALDTSGQNVSERVQNAGAPSGTRNDARLSHMPVAGESVSVVQLERAIRSARSEKE